LNVHTKRLLHDIFHIDPGISLRLPYQARQKNDMGRGPIPTTIWEITCHNLMFDTIVQIPEVDFSGQYGYLMANIVIVPMGK